MTATATEIAEDATPVVSAKVMDRVDAEQLDGQIRLLVATINDSLDRLHVLVNEAKTGRAWEVLGHKSWTAYLIDVFPSNIKLERGHRRELVGYLSGEGMSEAAIADTLGVARNTVRSDKAAQGVQNEHPEGRDGKVYKRPAKRKRRPSADLSRQEAQEITGRIKNWVDHRPVELGFTEAIDIVGRTVRDDKRMSVPADLDEAIQQLHAISVVSTKHKALRVATMAYNAYNDGSPLPEATTRRWAEMAIELLRSTGGACEFLEPLSETLEALGVSDSEVPLAELLSFASDPCADEDGE